MATSKTTERDITKIDGTQFFDNTFFQTSDALRRLSIRFRTVCDIPLLAADARITEAEAQLIFTFCYVCHHGLGVDWTTRAKRSLEDLHEYVAASNNHTLPYYVSRTYTGGPCDTVFPATLIEYYRQVISLMKQAVPDYLPLEAHMLPKKE